MLIIYLLGGVTNQDKGNLMFLYVTKQKVNFRGKGHTGVVLYCSAVWRESVTVCVLMLMDAAKIHLLANKRSPPGFN